MTTKTIAADDIRRLRRTLKENTTAFARRFSRSPRTVEDWEQGRRRPDAYVMAGLVDLARRTARKERSNDR